MINNLLFIVFFLAGMVGLIVSVIIICKKENFLQNALLSLCIFVLSNACIYSFYIFNGNLFDYPKILLALKSSTFLVAPCAYLYTKKVIRPYRKFKWYDSLHFIPAVLSLTYTMSSITLFVDSSFWVSNNLFFKMDFYTFNVMANLLWLLYAYTQCLLLVDNNKKIAFLPPNKILWVKTFSFMIMLLFVSLFIQKIAGFTRPIDFDIINNSIISFILLTSGFIVFFKPSMFFEIYKPERRKLISTDGADETDYTAKLSTCYLTKEKIEEYSSLIERALADKPFLQKGFVIRDLSQLTDIPVHHLSNFINSQHSLHFQDYINKKRIEYLIQQIDDKDWKNLSLEGQAWAVGFKSRTTFFRAFIKLTGQSPSEYINALKPGESKKYTATA